MITRLVYPVSKLKTSDYLFKYKGIDGSVYSIYRYLDKLHSKQLESIKHICLKHTLSLLGGLISVVFYDEQLNNRGYNKYLTIEGQATVAIDYEKYNQDAQWDGLKGYQTNTSLDKEQVIEQYSQLWEIERAFRISKSDLQIRPIYHRLHRRIEAHICISFVACKVYKELERQLYQKKAGISAEKTIDILKTIYKVSIQTPYSQNIYHRLILKTEEQKLITALFDLNI